ncbi:hypothetical protein AB4027_06780 [Alkalibacterium putridalgicola]|uniref:hypothetical protein n=1 Tax=Alkalibacterium putridalgicola TaxID=426703 RepID=UPI0034CF6049
MKKSVMMMPLLFTAVLGTIFFGRRYSAGQSEEMAEEQMTVSQREDETEKLAVEQVPDNGDKLPAGSSPAELLEYYEANSEILSLYQYLDYVSLKKENVTLAYYGEIDTNNTWVSKVTEKMQDSVSGEFTMIDLSFPGYDSYELYIEQTAQTVADEDPDVVIYGLPALSDQMRDMGLEETEEFMSYVLDRLLMIEDAKLITLEPFPVPGQMSQLNSRSLDYRNYISRMQKVSEEYNLPLIPLHADFTAEVPEDQLDDYYDETNELNETGNEQVFSLLDDWFSEEM